MSTYVVVIERGTKPNSFGAYVPDLPGCIAVGNTESEVRDLIGSAIRMHLAGMREDGLEIPAPSSTVHRISIGRLATIQAPVQMAASPRRATAKKASSAPGTRSKSVDGTHVTSHTTGKKAVAKSFRKKVRR